MSRRLAPTIGLLVGLAPAVAHAQTNIDQGKTPAQIFASDCAVCHKAPRGLANGKNSLVLGSFLREHYTASREEAASLAAYVLGAGGGDSVPAAQSHGQKPALEHARTPVEEPKPAVRQARQPAKPEEEAPADATPQHPAGEEAKPEEGGGVAEPSPGRRPAAKRNEPRQTTATRGRRKEQEIAPSHEVAPVIAAPVHPETPSQSEAPTPTAEAPTEPQPAAEGSSVPRDDIPD